MLFFPGDWILLAALVARGAGRSGYRVERQNGPNYRWAYVVAPDGQTAFGIEKTWAGKGVGWKAECWAVAEDARWRVSELSAMDYDTFMADVAEGVHPKALGPAIECGDQITRRLLAELGVLK